ncbi:MAG: 4Fe-4S dicluster domain-containing protein [Candidatus Bathyarchaeia archaeon]
MKRILVDALKCSGCRLCEMVCSLRHEARFSPSLSRVTVIKEDRYGFDYPVFCHQCDPCPSIAACPAGALTRIGDGTVHVDGESCTGCGACVEACTFDAVKLDGCSKPLICDLCGGDPACVERCPTEALSFVDYEGAFHGPEEALRGLMRRWGIVG